MNSEALERVKTMIPSHWGRGKIRVVRGLIDAAFSEGKREAYRESTKQLKEARHADSKQ
ncbi:hypothetical protein LCGC14_2904200 [marine sediment metagenome]|uniref:Uncharacterized protein n=1 Tax=marine sediment metagenome TaxID=412755 RepID=A0A0F8YFG5_9ZZZZ